jgi:hypothetical protein
MGVMDAVPAESVQEENNILDPLRGAAAELFGKQPKEEAPEKIALDQAMEKYKNNPKGLKAWLMKNRNILVWLNTSGSQMMDIVKQRIRETTTPDEEDEFHKKLDKLVHKTFGHSSDEKKKKKDVDEAEVTPGQALPKQIKVIKMPTPPQAPTGPDGTGEDGTRIGTTPKGNRSVSSGAGTYIFTPKGELMLYMTPKISGLQQTHNIKKQTVTINFGTTIDNVGIDQKATYDMSGKLISGDNTSIRSGNMGVSIDKDKGATADFKVDANTKVSANSKTGIKVN